ncbi:MULTISPECIES: iron transporter [unclassified Variovorax]|uniref:iron transporter n=1 Tax=unclassified Variovorax TaxID=663243 RepID=UPI003F47BE50
MSTGLRYRLGVASRAAAAIAGGYGVAALSAAVLALCLPAAFGMARSEAVTTGTLASFIVFALAVMWVFAARTAARAWSGLAVAAAPLAVLLFVLLRITGGAA